VDVVIGKLMAEVKSTESKGLMLRRRHDHVVLDVQAEQRHFWSPHMDVSVEKDEDSDLTLVRCLIGPTPTVWTMFMFFYGFFGFMAFVGLTLGMSQWTLQKDMWGFWLLPVAGIGMGLMYFISYEGQKLSRNEMRMMKRFVDRALECDCFALAEAQREN
jgi:hypothetical protein